MFGQEFVEAQNIPLVLLKSFEQIIVLMKNQAKQTIEKNIEALFTPSLIPTENKGQLDILKMKINLGNWNILKSVDSISLLIELVFTWIQFQIIHLISPFKIEKLLEKGNIKMHINSSNKYSLTTSEIYEIEALIKDVFSQSEVELLLFFADVLEEIESISEDVASFNKFKERLLVHSLGFSFEKAYDNSNKQEVHRIFMLVRTSLVILEALIIFDSDAISSMVGYFLNRTQEL